MDLSNLIALLSGVALFLFGMTLMGDGLKKVAGNKLELVLYKLSSSPMKGVLLGTGVTAIIQSSSATSVMVVSFVNSGMMKVRQAIGIVLGAILGTSITGWIICLSDLQGGSGWVSLLSTSTLTGVVAVVGILWYYRPRIFETVGWGIAVLLGLLTIVMSNYSFAILFVFAFSMLVLCRLPKRGGPTTAILLLCALAAIVVLPNLYRIFYFIAENTDSLKMQLRFIEVGNLLSGTGITEGSDAGTRNELYTASITTFLSAPLFGVGDLILKTAEDPRSIVGGHSIVCDYLAYYGLVGSILFHSILIANFYRIEKLLDRRGRFLYLVVFVLYYVQITVNAGYNEPLIEVLYLLVPNLLILTGERTARQREQAAPAQPSRYIRRRPAQW